MCREVIYSMKSYVIEYVGLCVEQNIVLFLSILTRQTMVRIYVRPLKILKIFENLFYSLFIIHYSHVLVFTADSLSQTSSDQITHTHTVLCREYC